MNLVIKFLRDMDLMEQDAALKCARIALKEKIPLGGVKRFVKCNALKGHEIELGFLPCDFVVRRTSKNLYVEKV